MTAICERPSLILNHNSIPTYLPNYLQWFLMKFGPKMIHPESAVSWHLHVQYSGCVWSSQYAVFCHVYRLIALQAAGWHQFTAIYSTLNWKGHVATRPWKPEWHVPRRSPVFSIGPKIRLYLSCNDRFPALRPVIEISDHWETWKPTAILLKNSMCRLSMVGVPGWYSCGPILDHAPPCSNERGCALRFETRPSA